MEARFYIDCIYSVNFRALPDLLNPGDLANLVNQLKCKPMGALEDMRLPLEPEGWYHIYNRGNEGRTIFFSPDQYRYFLTKYAAYMSPYWDTYAYCLLPNHFHLAVQIQSVDTILEHAPNDFKNVNRQFLKELSQRFPEIGIPPSDVDLLNFKNLVNLFAAHEHGRYQLAVYAVRERFRHFLLGYAKAVNQQQNRTGSLFQKLFRRRRVESEAYLATLIGYIHRNPLHHGLSSDWMTYPWSSYRSLLSEQATRLKRDKILEWFGGKALFEQTHLEYTENWKSIERFLIE